MLRDICGISAEEAMKRKGVPKPTKLCTRNYCKNPEEITGDISFS